MGIDTPLFPLHWPALLLGSPGFIAANNTDWFTHQSLSNEGDVLQQLFELFEFSFLFWWMLLSLAVHYSENIKSLAKRLRHLLRLPGSH